MTEAIQPPFSSRNLGAQAHIDNDCPSTARIAIVFLLMDLVEKRYVADWDSVYRELKRIARESIGDGRVGRSSVENVINNLEWEKLFDFCERLYSHLAREVHHYDGSGDVIAITPKKEVQQYIETELQRILIEEQLAFEFTEGIVRRRGKRHTSKQIARSELVLGDPRFSSARSHFNKALGFFRDVTNPDYENTVKEAVCTVEAVARVLFPEAGTTLGDIINSISGSNENQIPKTIGKTFHGLYGFRNGGEGVAHGGADGGIATKEVAEYSIAVAASQIILLVDYAASIEPDIPF